MEINSLIQTNKNSQLLSIKNAKYKIEQLKNSDDCFFTGAISNNLKYIMAGGQDQILKIWNYRTYDLIKSIYFDELICCCNFTEDSQLFYVGIPNKLCLFNCNNQFKKLSKQYMHNGGIINNIFCITNTIILISLENTIIKTDINNKQQLFKLQAHTDSIMGLDYIKILNKIASGSHDQSIKIWNGNDGSLIIQKLNAHKNNKLIQQVFFIINNNQLISLDDGCNIIIWNINYQKNKLEQLQSIEDSGYNISLIFSQQFIITTNINFIKVYATNGEFIRQFENDVNSLCKYIRIHLEFFRVIQHDSMKVVFIYGEQLIKIVKLEMD